VHRVGLDVDLAAVRGHGVAVSIAGAAHSDRAIAARAIGCRVSERAGAGACAAIVRVGLDVGLAPVDGHVVAVFEAGIAARDAAAARGALGRSVGARAHGAARTAVLGVDPDVGLAPVGGQAVAVLEAGIAAEDAMTGVARGSRMRRLGADPTAHSTVQRVGLGVASGRPGGGSARAGGRTARRPRGAGARCRSARTCGAHPRADAACAGDGPARACSARSGSHGGRAGRRAPGCGHAARAGDAPARADRARARGHLPGGSIHPVDHDARAAASDEPHGENQAPHNPT